MRLLVIGNGFDLDLGLKTKYYDFAQSVHFEKIKDFSQIPYSLASFMMDKIKEDANWFDIEETMAEYVKYKRKSDKICNNGLDEDRRFLQMLEQSFYDYVCDKVIDVDIQSWHTPIKDSFAKKIIEIQNKSNYFDGIYSFNCFDYQYLFFGGFENLFKINYVHNSTNNFLFGISSEDCLDERFSFLVKANQPGYPVDVVLNLLHDLGVADEIVIFGHSLNRIDMCYFKKFFECFSQTKQSITFVTKDESSKERLINNISRYAIPFELLAESGRVVFLLTDDFNSHYVSEDFKLFLGN